MAFELKFHPKAEQDLDNIIEYYNTLKEGLGYEVYVEIEQEAFSSIKRKKVIFEVVKYSLDIIVEFVDRRGDYKVKIDNNKFSAKETIKVQIVTSRGDIK